MFKTLHELLVIVLTQARLPSCTKYPGALKALRALSAGRRGAGGTIALVRYVPRPALALRALSAGEPVFTQGLGPARERERVIGRAPAYEWGMGP